MKDSISAIFLSISARQVDSPRLEALETAANTSNTSVAQRLRLLALLLLILAVSNSHSDTCSISSDNCEIPVEMSTVKRAQSIFLSHGGGPCFFLEPGGMLPQLDRTSATAQWYRDFAKNFVPVKPKAIIIFSAHWEARGELKITSNPSPPMYYDYGGFPDYTYKIEYPAKVDVPLAKRLKELFTTNGIAASLDDKRGWDHGIFVPLKLIYPEADVPLVQVSLNSNLDPALHYKIGELLEPLRDEGYMIMGSGYASHNLREFREYLGRDEVAPHTKKWANWLTEAVTNKEEKKRKDKLINWQNGPEARRIHPREEHLLPLHVVAGAASKDAKGAKEVYNYMFGNSALNCYVFE